jgi:hypothetical protein
MIGTIVDTTKPKQTTKAQKEAKTKGGLDRIRVTVIEGGLSFVVVDEGVEEDYEARHPEDGLYRETAPVRPEGSAPLPLDYVPGFQETGQYYQLSQYHKHLGNQLHRSVARRLLIFNAEAIQCAGQAGWYHGSEAAEAALPIVVDKLNQEYI